MKKLLFILTLLLLSSVSFNSISQDLKPKEAISKSEKLVVLWTSGDVEVAKKMVFMYVYNAKKRGWWKEITFIIWGPSSKLLSEDTELQDYLAKMKKEGITLEACKACADMYGVSEKLMQLDVDVKYMGVALTDYIKSENHVITF